MIKNERQYRIMQARAEEFRQRIAQSKFQLIDEAALADEYLCDPDQGVDIALVDLLHSRAEDSDDGRGNLDVARGEQDSVSGLDPKLFCNPVTNDDPVRRFRQIAQFSLAHLRREL